jgi:hypothetical protein
MASRAVEDLCVGVGFLPASTEERAGERGVGEVVDGFEEVVAVPDPLDLVTAGVGTGAGIKVAGEPPVIAEAESFAATILGSLLPLDLDFGVAPVFEFSVFLVGRRGGVLVAE